MRSVALLLLLVVWPCRAHLSGICTSTDTAKANEITFYLATYHAIPKDGSVPGRVHIKAPSGEVTDFKFNRLKLADKIKNGMTGAEWKKSVKDSFSLPDTAQVACYGEKPDGWSYTPEMHDADENGCFYRDVTTYYAATLERATSGFYEVSLSGTARQDSLQNTFSDRTHCICTATARVLIPAECSAIL